MTPRPSVAMHLRHAFGQHAFALPDGACEIVLVRHGASAPSPDGIKDDPGGGAPLSDLGRRQAAQVAARLSDETVGALFVSPLLRASATAEPLAELLRMTPVVVPDLREVSIGDWEGPKSRRIFDPTDPVTVEVFERERWDVVPGAEPAERLAVRVRGAIEQVRHGADGGVAVAITHGGFIAEACRQATGSRGFAFLGAENGSLTRLVILPDGAWVLRGFNDVSHLRTAAAYELART